MISGRNLSRKKTSSQNISISPYLRDWVERYVKMEQKKNPNDKRVKSMSSFYNYVMESVLKIFEKGKTLDDLERFVDKKVQNFYDKITFRALIPYYEQIIKINKYQPIEFDCLIDLFLKYRSFLIGKNEPSDEIALNMIERFKNFMLANKLTKDFKIDIINNSYIIEYSGYYPNIHYDHSKWIAGLAGLLGLKIKNLIISNNFLRLDLEKTSLFKIRDLEIERRKEIFYYNVNEFTNWYRVIDDKTQHLWLKMSNNKDIIINFKDVTNGLEFINSIIRNLGEYAKTENLVLDILKLFRHFRWIDIENFEKPSFRFCVEDKYHHIIREMVFNILQKMKVIIKEENEIFYLNLKQISCIDYTVL